MVTVGHVSVYGVILASLTAGVSGGVAFKNSYVTVSDRLEKEGLKVVKEGTEMKDLKGIINKHSSEISLIITSIRLPDKEANENADSQGVSNGLNLKRWCRVALQRHAWFVDHKLWNNIRKYCVIVVE